MQPHNSLEDGKVTVSNFSNSSQLHIQLQNKLEREQVIRNSRITSPSPSPVMEQKYNPQTPTQYIMNIPGNVGMRTQLENQRRARRWYLGIQSKKEPSHVMTEVYRALLGVGCSWLRIEDYKTKIKWCPNQ